MNEASLPTSVAANMSEKVLSLQERKALEFLSTSTSYDMNLALVICQLHNFKVAFILSYIIIRQINCL
jgi:hypothetical protein